MGYTGGADLNQLGEKSLMRLVTEYFHLPRAADPDYFVASVDPDGLTAGQQLTIAALGAAGNVDYPRRVTLRIVDNAFGSALVISILVTGQRQGRAVTETITATSVDTNPLTVTGSKIFDQVTSVQLLLKTNAAASDDLQVGIAGSALGLKYKIRSVTDVISIIEWDSGTPQTPQTISSTNVDVDDSCIQGLTLAVTDVWKVVYIARGDDGIGSNGVFP